MGQAAALETTLNRLITCTFIANFFAGQVIYDIGGLCRIAPPNSLIYNLLTIVQSDVRGGSNKLERDQQRKHRAHAQPSVRSSRPLQLKN